MATRKLNGGRLPLVLLFAAVFLVILVLSALSPMVDDDFSYCFSWADVSRITSISQIPASMAMHRQLTNGRVFAHAVVQLLLIRPKAAFVLLNACNAALLCFLFYRYFRRLPAGQAALLLAIGAMMLWNYTTDFFRIFLWLDGSVNYSWGISLILLYLWPYVTAYLGEAQKSAWWRTALFLLLSLIAGGYSENSSLAALFIACVLTLVVAVREKRVSWRLLAGIAAAVVGYAFLMSAPATAGRAGEFSFSALANRLRQMVDYCQKNLSAPYLIYAAALALALTLKADRRRIFLSVLFFVAGLASLAAFLFAFYFTDRHCCFTVFFTVLATLLLLGALPEKKQKLPAALLAGCMAVCFAFNFVSGGLDILVGYGKAREREQLIREAREAGVTELALPCYSAATKYCGTFYLFPDPDAWPNDSAALYYGFDALTGLEETPG
ncbi:MAG: hypothetical protein IJ594_03640 [Oscillospiraceae bacterium]|nr:hypothetical protein [Oscillospiraceae bacterium]